MRLCVVIGGALYYHLGVLCCLDAVRLQSGAVGDDCGGVIEMWGSGPEA